jgi:SAM-dependent methyltransferase
MYDFHLDNDSYFQMQQQNCEEFVIPFIEETNAVTGARVLEIGCGTAGVLNAFLEKGCWGVGVDLNGYTLGMARERLSDRINSGQVKLILKDIYLVNPELEFGGKFDIIVLKDVIEHIHNQEKLINRLKSFLNPDGVVFFGFPPWQMPFGGHQQMCHSRFLSRLPYFHLLPMSLYRAILKAFKESPDELCEVKETGISIERFEKIAEQTGYEIVNRYHFFINPIYKYKFNMRVRKQAAFVSAIPYLRDFFTTSVFYLLKIK